MWVKHEIVREDSDTVRHVYDFSLYEAEVRLQSYEYQERPTKRHKWKCIRQLGRISTNSWLPKVKIEDVPHLKAVAQEALEYMRGRVALSPELTSLA